MIYGQFYKFKISYRVQNLDDLRRKSHVNFKLYNFEVM